MSGKSRNRVVGSCNITDVSKNYSGMLSNEMPDDVMHKRIIRVISEEFTATSKKDFLMDSHLLETEKHLKAKVSFRKYCKTLLMDFLARVLSQVATVAQSWKKAMWKLLVFLICSGGFLYQTNEFLTFYWTFPTTTSLEESSPYEIITPAITFCSNNFMNRATYCEKYPDECFDDYNNTQFCSEYPKFCINYMDRMERNTKLPNRGTLSSYILSERFRDWELANELNPTKEDDLRGCWKTFGDKKIYRSCVIRRFPFVINSRPAFCYTIESQLYEPNSEDEKVSTDYSIEHLLRTYPDEYFRHSDPVQYYAAVHNRRHLVNPYENGIVLKGGKSYIFFVSMNEVVRLPFPYTTNCTDYLKLWRQNNGTGPLNQKECIQYCKVQKLLSNNSCIDRYTSYAPHTGKICDRYSMPVSSVILQECSSECQPACLEQEFEIKYEETEEEHYKNFFCMENDGCKLQNIELQVLFSNYRLSREIHTAKIEDVELFSYVGGFIGLWLGISLITVFDLLESFAKMLLYPIKNKKINASVKHV